jgi:hypothetical protein
MLGTLPAGCSLPVLPESKCGQQSWGKDREAPTHKRTEQELAVQDSLGLGGKASLAVGGGGQGLPHRRDPLKDFRALGVVEEVLWWVTAPLGGLRAPYLERRDFRELPVLTVFTSLPAWPSPCMPVPGPPPPDPGAPGCYLQLSWSAEALPL